MNGRTYIAQVFKIDFFLFSDKNKVLEVIKYFYFLFFGPGHIE